MTTWLYSQNADSAGTPGWVSPGQAPILWASSTTGLGLSPLGTSPLGQ